MTPALNILSFDIEEWFMSYDSSQIPVKQWKTMPARIEQNIHDILHFLEASQLTATFYIMGWVAEHYPILVSDIFAAGHEIGYHSYYHESPLMQGPKAFEEDLVRGLDLLQSLTGQKVMQYRAPRFSLDSATAFALPLLHKHGITLSSSVMSGHRCKGITIPDHPFIFEVEGIQMPEVPLNRKQTLGLHWVYTGSGYFRILPLWLIKSLYAASPYNMAYFHPRDFDTHVPKTTLLPFYRNIMSNLGNHSTLPKLKHLITQHSFQPVGKAWQHYQQTQSEITIFYL